MTRSRRQFTKTLAMGVAAASVADFTALILDAQKKARRLKVGHTGITWGFKPTDAEGAIKDVAALGYHGYESFGGVLEYWEQQGGFDAKLKAALKDPEFVKKQEGLGAVVVTDKRMEGAEHKKFVAAEIAKWSPVIKAAGVYVD